jgi:hypothetical protein
MSWPLGWHDLHPWGVALPGVGINRPTWRTSLRSLEPNVSKACTLHGHLAHVSRAREIDTASFGVIETDFANDEWFEIEISEARVIETRCPERCIASSVDAAVVEEEVH